MQRVRIFAYLVAGKKLQFHSVGMIGQNMGIESYHKHANSISIDMPYIHAVGLNYYSTLIK